MSDKFLKEFEIERNSRLVRGRRLHRSGLGELAREAVGVGLSDADAVRQAGRPAEQGRHDDRDGSRSAGRADDPPRFPRRVRGAAGIRDGGLRGDQGPLRPQRAATRRTPAGNTPITSGCSPTTCQDMAPIDQIEQLCRQLADTPYTRRAQAITWKVWEDSTCYDPACLQSIWCRITPEDGGPC